MTPSDPPHVAHPSSSISSRWRWFIPSPFDLFCILAIVLALLLSSFSTDLWWRLTTGQWILRSLDVPRDNLLSFAAENYPWVNHEWLTDTGMFWILDRLGLRWLHLLKALGMGLTVGICFLSLRRRGGLIPSVMLGLLVLVGLLTVLEREPLMMSCLLLAILLSLLESPRWTGLPALALVPPLFWAWASLHGAFQVGLGLVWLYCLGELLDASRRRADRRWVLHLPMAGLATLFALWNPYYISLFTLGFEELWQLLGTSALRLQLLSPAELLLELVVLFAASLILLATGREVRWRLALPWLFLTPIVLIMPGYGCLWALWGAFTLMEHVQQIVRRIRHERQGYYERLGQTTQRMRVVADRMHRLSLFEQSLPRGPLLLVFVVSLLVLFSVPGAHGLGGMLGQDSLETVALTQKIPVKVVDVLVTQCMPGARVLAPLEWSGYISWAGQEGVMTFIDAREGAHPLSSIEDYDRVRGLLPGWEEILDQYEVEQILWPAESFMPRALLTSGLWREVVATEQAILIERLGESEPESEASPTPAATSP